MFKKILPDLFAVLGLAGVGYGLYHINQYIAFIVVGGVLFLLGLAGSLKN